MPLDATKRQLPVIILPQQHGYRFGTFTLWLLSQLLLAALAHAQPTSWQSRQEGSITRYQGTDANGGQWTGSSLTVVCSAHTHQCRARRYKQAKAAALRANSPRERAHAALAKRLASAAASSWAGW